jgi:hypothetical protein
MNNLVVQLLLRTGTFSTDLKTARGQIQNFQQGCQTAGKSLSGFGQALGLNVGSLAKFGGAVGAAALAGKALKGIIDSTQTSADAFDGAIAGCKGVVDALAVSIASADFSTFQNGLWGVFDAAKAARDALDDLQDAQLGYGMLSSRNRREFTEAQTAYKEAQTQYNNAKTKSERDKWVAEMDKQRKKMEDTVVKEEEAAKNFETKNFNAIKSQVVARNTNIQEHKITSQMIYDVAEIFNSVNSDERRKQAKEAADKVKKEAKKYATDSKRDQYYQEHQRELIIDALLEMGDKKIQAVAQELQAGENAVTSASSMRKAFVRTTSSGERGTTGGGTKTTRPTTAIKEEEEYEDESIVYWDKILKYEQEHLRHINKSNKDWETSKANLKEAQEEIRKLQNEIMGVLTPDEKSYVTYKSLLSAATELRDSIDDTTPEWGEQNQKVLELESIVSRIEKKMSLISMKTKLEEALAISPATEESLETIVRILTQLKRVSGIGTDEYNKYAEDLKKYQEQLKAVRGVSSNVMKTPADSFSKITSSISTLTSGLYTLSDAFMKISGDAAGTENEFKKFLDVVQTGVSVFQAMASIIQTVTTLQEILGAVSLASAAEQAAASGVAATAEAAAAGTEVAANTAVAASGAAASQAGIPVVGPALAVAAVAAVLAAITAAISSSQKVQRFANGGIVGGSSFTGDRVSAQVNSGEMILNKTQQANLFKLANGGGTGKEVTFHISGTDLVGVMNNINRKNKVIR